jgi:hypothetical protein
MEKKKFGMLNTSKKEVVTHAELQKTEVVKRGDILINDTTFNPIEVASDSKISFSY